MILEFGQSSMEATFDQLLSSQFLAANSEQDLGPHLLLTNQTE